MESAGDSARKVDVTPRALEPTTPAISVWHRAKPRQSRTAPTLGPKRLRCVNAPDATTSWLLNYPHELKDDLSDKIDSLDIAYNPREAEFHKSYLSCIKTHVPEEPVVTQ